MCSASLFVQLAYPARRYCSEFVEYSEATARRKVLFATSYAMITPQKRPRLSTAPALTTDRELFLEGAARRVFRLD